MLPVEVNKSCSKRFEIHFCKKTKAETKGKLKGSVQRVHSRSLDQISPKAKLSYEYSFSKHQNLMCVDKNDCVFFSGKTAYHFVYKHCFTVTSKMTGNVALARTYNYADRADVNDVWTRCRDCACYTKHFITANRSSSLAAIARSTDETNQRLVYRTNRCLLPAAAAADSASGEHLR